MYAYTVHMYMYAHSHTDTYLWYIVIGYFRSPLFWFCQFLDYTCMVTVDVFRRVVGQQ